MMTRILFLDNVNCIIVSSEEYKMYRQKQKQIFW